MRLCLVGFGVLWVWFGVVILWILDGWWYCFGSGFWVLVCGLVALGLVVVYGGCRRC